MTNFRDDYKSIHLILMNLLPLQPHCEQSSVAKPSLLLSVADFLLLLRRVVHDLKFKSLPTLKILSLVPVVQDGKVSAPSKTEKKKTQSPQNHGQEKNYQ